MVRFGARDFDPSVGRWVSKDPIRFVGSEANLYVYAGDDPNNAVDPGGERPSPACVARAREVCQQYCWGCGQSACVEICTDLAANWVCRDCDSQFEGDNDVCRSLPDPAARSRCFGSATSRYGACMAGKALPPLITW